MSGLRNLVAASAFLASSFVQGCSSESVQNAVVEPTRTPSPEELILARCGSLDSSSAYLSILSIPKTLETGDAGTCASFSQPLGYYSGYCPKVGSVVNVSGLSEAPNISRVYMRCEAPDGSEYFFSFEPNFYDRTGNNPISLGTQ